jgi:hypothetical protein
MECSIPTFPEIKAPLLFKKALAWEKRREGLHAMFSKMFEEFTRECFFSPLLISFFGGDISNVNITEDSQCSLSPIPPSLVTKAAGLGASETRMQPDTSADHGAAHHIDKSDSSRKLIAKTTSSALDMPIDMQGELWYQNKQKTNGVNDQWKKRYFSTDSSGDKAQLYMWKDENKGTLLNSLDLSKFNIEHKAQPTMSMLGLGSKTPASMVLVGEEQGGQEIVFRGKSNHEVLRRTMITIEIHSL